MTESKPIVAVGLDDLALHMVECARRLQQFQKAPLTDLVEAVAVAARSQAWGWAEDSDDNVPVGFMDEDQWAVRRFDQEDGPHTMYFEEDERDARRVYRRA